MWFYLCSWYRILWGLSMIIIYIAESLLPLILVILALSQKQELRLTFLPVSSSVDMPAVDVSDALCDVRYIPHIFRVFCSFETDTYISCSSPIFLLSLIFSSLSCSSLIFPNFLTAFFLFYFPTSSCYLYILQYLRLISTPRSAHP